MPDGGFFFGWLIAFALCGLDVEQLRPFHVLYFLQHTHQLLDVVAIHGSEIADVHTLKNVLLTGDEGFHGIVETQDALSAVFVDNAPLLQCARCTEAQAVVGTAGVEIKQVLFHAAHTLVDAHVVIVEDNEHIVRLVGGIVESLESQTATHGTIADDSHDVPVFFLLLHGSHRHAERSRDGVAGMATGKRVVLALIGRGERAQPAKLAVCLEKVAASGEDFMGVCLMPHVPHDAVVGRAEHIVQGHGEFYHTEARRQVSGIDREFTDNVRPQFFAERRKLLLWQLAEVFRRVDVR